MLDILDKIADNIFIKSGNTNKTRLRKRTLGGFSKMRELENLDWATLKRNWKFSDWQFRWQGNLSKCKNSRPTTLGKRGAEIVYKYCHLPPCFWYGQNRRTPPARLLGQSEASPAPEWKTDKCQTDACAPESEKPMSAKSTSVKATYPQVIHKS